MTEAKKKGDAVNNVVKWTAKNFPNERSYPAKTLIYNASGEGEGESTTPESTTPKSTTPESTTPEKTTPESTTPEKTTSKPGNPGGNADGNGGGRKVLLPSTGEVVATALVFTGVLVLLGAIVMKRKMSK